MIRTCLLLTGALLSQAALSQAITVERFVADPVAVLDAQGKLQGELATSTLPKPPLPVLQYNESLELVQVQLNGKMVWLDTQDVEMKPGKGVKLPCAQLKSSQAADAQNNSTIGFGAGCNKP